ncbi:response regulator transcription factor [soil metagenome]
MINVVIVDDQAMIRFALRGILESAGDIAIIGEAENGHQGVSIGRALSPDVMVLDLRMPEMDGLDAIRRIRSEPDYPPMRILVLTTFENDENVLEALRAGANGFIGKGVEPSELIAAVREVGAGHALLSPAATQSVIDHLANQVITQRTASALSSPDQVSALTPREREIIVMIATGLIADEIAERLFISPLTVKTHINNAMSKLGVRNRTQLVRVALDYGLIDQT